MKVIELLTKIANGEEVPKEIRIGDKIDIFYYQDYVKSYKTYDNEYLMCEYLCNTDRLNDEVEIIEEDKKIEKLENEKQFYSYRKYADIKNDIDKILYIIKGLNLTEEKIDNLNNKINEIIDYINGGTNGE